MVLRSGLSRSGQLGTYERAAKAAGLSEPAVRVWVHRLRQRYAELFRGEIARTVSDPREVEEEIRYLFKAIRT